MALDYKSSLSRYRRYLQMVQTQPLWTASLWVMLSLILLIILLVLALRPTLVTIADLMGKIKQQREVSKQLENKIFTVQKALENLDAVNDKLGLLDEALPKETEWKQIADKLQFIATGSGIALDNILISKIPLTPIDPASKQEQVSTMIPQGIIPIRFTYEITGDYESVRQVVSKIENTRRIIIVSRVQVLPTKDGGGWHMTMQGETGYLPDKFIL